MKNDKYRNSWVSRVGDIAVFFGEVLLSSRNLSGWVSCLYASSSNVSSCGGIKRHYTAGSGRVRGCRSYRSSVLI